MTIKSIQDNETLRQLLAELEEVLRTAPLRATARHETPDNLAWLGRAAAAIGRWSPARAIAFNGHIAQLGQTLAAPAGEGYRGIVTILHEAQNDLRFRVVGPKGETFNVGAVFDFFDSVRQRMAEARTELFFVDPYLHPDFLSRFLPHVPDGVSVRLLTMQNGKSTEAALAVFKLQNPVIAELRLAEKFHDRYLFVDRGSGWLSSASFKDAAGKYHSTITPLTDTLNATLDTYEGLWAGASVIT